MASESDMVDSSLRNIILPLLISVASQHQPDRAALPYPVIHNVVLIGGFGNLESLFLDKEGPPPASKAAIEAMPAVEVTESGKECVICLEDFEVGGEARNMPCKHGFHSGCIEKWLGIHGSCPVCRYRMPVEEEEKRSGDYGGRESRVRILAWRSSDSGLDWVGEFDETDGNGEADDGASPMDWTPEPENN